MEFRLIPLRFIYRLITICYRLRSVPHPFNLFHTVVGDSVYTGVHVDYTVLRCWVVDTFTFYVVPHAPHCCYTLPFDAGYLRCSLVIPTYVYLRLMLRYLRCPTLPYDLLRYVAVTRLHSLHLYYVVGLRAFTVDLTGCSVYYLYLRLPLPDVTFVDRTFVGAGIFTYILPRYVPITRLIYSLPVDTFVYTLLPCYVAFTVVFTYVVHTIRLLVRYPAYALRLRSGCLFYTTRSVGCYVDVTAPLGSRSTYIYHPTLFGSRLRFTPTAHYAVPHFTLRYTVHTITVCLLLIYGLRSDRC